jgi:8-oxoguanine deaminase
VTDLVIERAAAILTAWDADPIFDAWVAISDGRVNAVGTGQPPAAARVIDARNALIVPGAVAAHHHLFQGSSRGVVVAGDLIDWLATHYRAWASLTEADVEMAASLSLALLAFGGATTVAAFEYIHPKDEDFVGPVVRAAQRIGLRLLYVRGCAPRLEGALAERLAAQGVAIDRLVEPEDRALMRTSEVLERPSSATLRWACGPTTPVVDDNGQFHHALSEIASSNGCGIHTHFHPIVGKRESETAAAMAARLGLVRPGNWFAHGSRLTVEDVRQLGTAGVGVVHAPSCSILLGYPVPPLRAWRRGNARVAISVDGAASNDRSSMLLEGQLAWQLQRAVHGVDAGLTPREVFELMTEAPARMLGWPGLGRLDIGAAADLAVIDLTSPELSGAPSGERDVIGRLFRLYSGGRVRHLVVGGRIVVEESRLTGADERVIAAAATASAARLFDTTQTLQTQPSTAN